jgi:hypothetical protein
MKEEQKFEINSHSECLRTRWYCQVHLKTRKGFHEIKKRTADRRGN